MAADGVGGVQGSRGHEQQQQVQPVPGMWLFAFDLAACYEPAPPCSVLTQAMWLVPCMSSTDASDAARTTVVIRPVRSWLCRWYRYRIHHVWQLAITDKCLVDGADETLQVASCLRAR
eukprot:3720656-Rhodomonas_salina.2